MRILAWIILLATIIFNLYLNYPETKILADPNDNIFQYSLVYRTNWIWENYGCPLSLSCLPNLVDHNVTAWAEGYPLPFYYSHIPQIATVASYQLIIKPISSLFPSPLTLYAYYNWTKYLLFTLLPIPVFLALRIVGFSPLISVIGAFFASHLSTDGLYGIDPVSFLWRGYGLTSQLYGLFFLPLALAFTYRALSLKESHKDTTGEVTRRVYPVRSSPGVEESEKERFSNPSTIGRVMAQLCSACHSRGVLTALAVLFLTLTIAGHLGIGIIGILSTLPFLFLDLNMKNIIARGKKLLTVYCLLFFILSYWIVPILLNNNYHIISFWDPIWKFDSYGWKEVVRQYLQGEIFDWQRAPIVTLLTTIGFFVLLIRNHRHSGESRLNRDDSRIPLGSWTSQDDNLHVFSLLFAFWILMYFGRTTWGGLIDFIPGMKDFHQHRFIVGVHMAALFLIPAGVEYLMQLLKKLSNFLSYLFTFGDFRKFFLAISEGLKTPRVKSDKDTSDGVRMHSSEVEESEDGRTHKLQLYINIIFYILTLTFISILAYSTVQKTIQYAQLNNRWIGEANNAYRYDEKNFQNLVKFLNTLPSTRVYAGRPGNWGHDFRLGSTQMYMLFGVNGFDMSQFLPETWSPLSENEQNFDERVKEDYDLLNIRYIVSPKNQGFAEAAKMDKKFGPFELYQIPTSGWFDVVTSPMFVKTDKTNFINLVHLWQRSYPRVWKMYPLISVEKNPEIPQGLQKIIEMKDEVSYSEINEQPTTNNQQRTTKNIFSDFPFVFPEATVSAYLKESGKDTSGVTGTGSPDGGGIRNNVAIISNERVNKQTYSATVEVPQNCKLCFIMFKMSYHPDWHVKVDGKPASKFAVFPFYLATQATPGTHSVEFTYEPNSLKVVLLAGEILIGILFLFRKRLRSILFF